MKLTELIIKYLKKKSVANYNDCNNVVDSIAKAKQLHKSLIVRCHPDKNIKHHDLALQLSELVNSNRYNYLELVKLEKRINKELLSKNSDL